MRGGDAQERTDAAAESDTTAFPEALVGWLGSSGEVRCSPSALVAPKGKHIGGLTVVANDTM